MASRGLVQRLAKSNNGYLASALVRRLEGRHSTPSNQLIRSFVTNGESSQTTTKNAETAQSSSLQHEIKKLRSELQSKFELVESKLKHSDDILEIKLEEVRQRMQSEIEATKLESLKFDTIIITTVAAAMVRTRPILMVYWVGGARLESSSGSVRYHRVDRLRKSESLVGESARTALNM
ncbi:hypothetical protein Sjap_019799 [Stephania japonica]|uniref:Uncharacterized protein n=1 Tax=Stephania japonica TaxID=461633 RepID=A0AAP0F267_9MAGN